MRIQRSGGMIFRSALLHAFDRDLHHGTHDLLNMPVLCVGIGEILIPQKQAVGSEEQQLIELVQIHDTTPRNVVGDADLQNVWQNDPCSECCFGRFCSGMPQGGFVSFTVFEIFHGQRSGYVVNYLYIEQRRNHHV